MLIRNGVILNFQIKIILPENISVIHSNFLCRVIIPQENRFRNGACQTGGQGDQSLVILNQKLPIHARTHIESLCKAARYQCDQIPITGFVFGKQHQMVAGEILFSFLSIAGYGRDIDLAADNRFDPLPQTSLIKGNSAVQNPMVSDCNRCMPSLFCGFRNVADTTGTVKQTVFTVQMEMNKI